MERWYPVIIDLHRFFIATSRAVVNHDGSDGTAPDPSVGSAGALPKRRPAGSCGSGPGPFPRPPGIWDSEWVKIPASAIGADDIAHWPYTTGLLVKWVAFLVPYIGLLVVWFLELVVSLYVVLLILCELWAGERLSREKAHPRYLRSGRPISMSALPFCPALIFGALVVSLGAMMRYLCLLPGGLGRFVPCSIGADYCRLRHIGWEKCGHGLSSRPRETAL